MKNKIIGLILLLFIINQSIKSQYDKLFFEQLSTEQGLSNNRVYSIIQDKKGFMWFGTLYGLNKYDGYSFKIYKSNPLDSSPSNIHNNRIVSLFEDKKSNIWIGTEKNGIEKFDPNKETFTYFPPEKNKTNGIPFSDVKGFFEMDNKLYAQFDSFVYLFDSKLNKFIPAYIKPDKSKENNYTELAKQIKSNTGFDVKVISSLTDKYGVTWIGTEANSLFIKDKQHIFNYTNPPFNSFEEIYTIYQDKFGIIWFGTRNNGLFKHNPVTRQFKHFNYLENKNEIINDLTVRSITEDLKGKIWIGTYNNGLICFNPQNNSFKHIKSTLQKNQPNDNKIRSLFTDSEGKIWVGSYDGIAIYSDLGEKISQFEIENEANKKCKPYTSAKLYFDRVYGFTEDVFGNIWIANWDALSCFNKKTKMFKHYPASFFGVKHIRKIYIDKNNTIWFCCEFGGLVQFNATDEHFERYYQGKTKNNLVYNNVFDVYEDNNQNLWIATFNGLDKFERDKGYFKHFFTNQGLPGNMIYGILNDNKGNLWLTTTNGLSRLNINDEQFVNISSKSGLLTYEFAEGGFYKSKKNGCFIIGGINGFDIFHPDSIKINQIPPDMVITNIKILNKSINPNNSKFINKNKNEPLVYSKEIILNPNENVITIEFAALHYAIPEKNICKYKLEGFDKDWVLASGQQRMATYTNLKPGSYTFKVMGCNCDQCWCKKDCSLNIIVLPPFWLTSWAYLLYAITLIIVAGIYRYFTLKKLKIKNALTLEKMNRNKIDEINQMKINFFTNISHEIRTPLTLIITPIEKILKAPANTYISEFRNQLFNINRNAQNLLNLSNQILELRKLETGKIHLITNKIFVNKNIIGLINQFKDLAVQKGLIFEYFPPEKDFEAWLDIEKFEIIIHNLLSNAIKYNNTINGKIKVWLNAQNLLKSGDYSYSFGTLPGNEFFELSVEDTGIGIPSKLFYDIFNHFYRIENQYTSKIQGAGIGLTILKELVLIHKGLVLVKSIEGEGSTFTIRLPLGNKHLSPDQMTETIAAIDNHKEIKSFSELKPALFDDIKVKPHLKSVLIIEDNLEIRNYLHSELSQKYNIYQSDNGKEGLEIIFKKIPDLILCDTSLPVLNGIEICKRIKHDQRTSHIPIILLSSNINNENKVEVYDALADDFMGKPFNITILMARIYNLLEIREKVKNAIIFGNYEFNENTDQNMQPLDEEFLRELNKYVNQNISDTDFNVSNLSKALNISRSTLHLKLKNLTNLSATDYIKNIRLDKALELLKEKKHTISEISYLAGFNSSSYFIKCFKEKYGVTPKEFVES